MKKAILVVSFGTSHLDTLKKTIGAVEEDICRAFSEYEVRRAFTSQVIINKLCEQYKIKTDNVESAFIKLIAEGFDEVICAVTHIINGFEYDKVTEIAGRFSDRIKIFVTRPLVSLTEDYSNIIDALNDEFPQNKHCVLMGHGTEHFSNAVYPALKYHLDLKGFNNVHIGTVEGFPGLCDVISEMQNSPIKKAVLMPFMFVAGDHAKNDMAVDWRETLENHGFEVECVMKGLGEYKAVRELYVMRIRQILNE